MPKILRTLFAITFFLASSQSFSHSNLPDHVLLQGGAFYSTQGQSQNVYIATLVGDRYSVTEHNKWNDVFGIGVLMDGWQCGQVLVDYGINVFYLARTKVSGDITQEQLFTNLAFRYYITHVPVYATARAWFNPHFYGLFAVLDAGLGPNFMRTSSYSDAPLNDFTLPDNAYRGHTDVVLSGTIGLGMGVCLTDEVSVELDYRFFYLGRGHLVPNNSAVLNDLSTGTNYANALILTISI